MTRCAATIGYFGTPVLHMITVKTMIRLGGRCWAKISRCWFCDAAAHYLTLKASNKTVAEFSNTADPDETAHNEPSYLDLECLPSSP